MTQTFNFFIPICSLELFRKYFVPDSIRFCYLLKAEARESYSINVFRKNISVEIVNPPSYYVFGKTFNNIIHTKLRKKCVFNMIFTSSSQILHFVHADTLKMYKISLLYVNIIIMPETIWLINYLCLTSLILIQLYHYTEIYTCLCRLI